MKAGWPPDKSSPPCGKGPSLGNEIDRKILQDPGSWPTTNGVKFIYQNLEWSICTIQPIGMMNIDEYLMTQNCGDIKIWPSKSGFRLTMGDFLTMRIVSGELAWARCSCPSEKQNGVGWKEGTQEFAGLPWICPLNIIKLHDLDCFGYPSSYGCLVVNEGMIHNRYEW